MFEQIPANISIPELMTEMLPKITKESIVARGADKELAGTEIRMSVNVSDKIYSYVLKNGKEIAITEGDQENVMIRLQGSEEDFKKMIENKQLDLILLVLTELDPTKYNTLKTLEGSFVAKLTNFDGSFYTLKAIFNEKEEPSCVFTMSTADTEKLMKREENPVNLFMSGAMQIEGNMAFAVATQPLFV